MFGHREDERPSVRLEIGRNEGAESGEATVEAAGVMRWGGVGLPRGRGCQRRKRPVISPGGSLDLAQPDLESEKERAE